jgi:hypothetical protein
MGSSRRYEAFTVYPVMEELSKIPTFKERDFPIPSYMMSNKFHWL